MGEMNMLAPTGLNDRISPEYLVVQKNYHQIVNYGITGHNYAEDVRQIVRLHGIKTILDYGCGQGTLKQEVSELDIREYDPAIPGKDGEPQRADLLVCTDVLEHIEPQKLNSVLEHIRRLGDWIFLVIATRPAIKNLPDGRNAHLIVQNADWWKKKLEACFDIKTWEVQELGVVCLMKPYLLIGEINGKGVMEYDDRLKHIKENIKVTDKRIKPRKLIYWSGDDVPMFGFRLGFDEKGKPKWAVPQPHNRVAIVMCYGPSLQDTWQMAIDEKEFIERSDIVSVSGAHDFLISKGIIPKYHIECDPRKHKGDMISKKHPKVEYLMASVCHPDVIKKVKGKNLSIWHMNEGDPSLAILELEPNSILVPGGGSVGLRSIALLYVMGYRRFLIHGMDCSFRGKSDEPQSHAGHHTGKKVEPVEIRCTDGRKFLTAPVLITYQRYFDDMRRSFVGDADKDATKIEIILRGDGLLQHWLKVAGGAEGHNPTVEAA